MAVLEPTLCVLDETDSGLDIDAVRIVSEGVNKLRSKDRAMLVITHYQRLLEYIVAGQGARDGRGKIRKTGGKELALELEKTGYAEFKSKSPRECLRRLEDMTVALTKTRWSRRSPTASRLSPRSCQVGAPSPTRARLHRRVRGAGPATPAHRAVEVHGPSQRAEGCPRSGCGRHGRGVGG